MAEDVAMRIVEHDARRALNEAAALAQEQLTYAIGIARNAAPAGQAPDPLLVAALVQAIATNFAAVK